MTHQAFILKQQQRAALTLRLLTSDCAAIAAQLDHLLTQGPKFFNGALLILNCEHLNQASSEFFTRLENLFTQKGIHINAVLEDAQGHHLGSPWPTIARQPKSQPLTQNTAQTQIIQRPVRSGQQVIAEQGDLIVIGSVSAGAELLAYGNIHVYGTLRGKALAGIEGHTHAVILCQSLEAELVAIAGQHHLTAQMPAHCLGQGPVLIQRQAAQLSYQALMSTASVL